MFMIESSKTEGKNKILSFGMVGGGEGSFIGDVHRKAAAFDGKCQLVSGCFSRDYSNTLKVGESLRIPPDRLYKTFKDMALNEAKREDKPDFISIVAQNNFHYECAKAFLEQGFNVVCEKPLTFEVEQAEELKKLAADKEVLFCVMYSYSGYPMIKQARKLVLEGKIGDILMVMGEYPQDWLITSLEKEDQKQAAWRTDPNQAGVSNCTGDIGSHIEHMVSFITGLKIDSLCAKLDNIGEGRKLDTNSSILLKYNNGATGVYWSSQIAIGNDNGLRVRIYGTKGSIEWSQEDPNVMRVTYAGEPVQIMSRGHSYLYPEAGSRIPTGHTEGYYEAFANIYNKFASALLKKKEAQMLTADDLDFPNVDAGIDGVKFVNAAVKSSKEGSIWVKL